MAGERIFDSGRSPLAKGVNLIEASAGTGKTYAIGMLVLRLIVEQGVSIERILVVTFTKAASEELRGRIRQRLLEARALLAQEETSVSGPLADWAATLTDRQAARMRLRRALSEIDRAAIFTIHSFCRQMLFEQALESGQPFEVELLADIRQVQNQVVEDFWRSRLYRLAPEPCQVVLARYPTPAALSASIAVPGLIEARLEPDTVSFAEAVDRFTSCRTALGRWWRQHGEALADFFADAREKGQLKKDFAVQFPGWWRALTDWLTGNGAGPVAQLDCLSRAGIKRVLNGTKVRKNRQDAFLEKWPLADHLVAELLAAADALTLALRLELVGELADELQRRLGARGQMSFDELIMALDRALAAEGGDLAPSLGERFDAALIDEFQDTDSAQWRIFSCLFAGGGHYLYLIGDPKQAIYRFRGADIHSYFAARSQADHQATLSHNYRSHPLLVAAVNGIFASGADPFALGKGVLPFFPVSPAKTADDGQLVKSGRPLPTMLYCQLESCDSSAWSSGRAAQRILEYVVGEVCRLLDRDEPVSLCTTREGAVTERVVTPRDIAVLVRSNRQADDYLQAFARRGVPVVVTSKKSVFETGEATELLTLLAALAAPGDLTAVKRAMTLSWFGLSGNELVAIWEDDAAFNVRFGRLILYHQLWRERGFLAMMNRLLADEEVYLHLAAAELAERRIANIGHLLELVQEAEVAGNLGPERTLVWLQSMVAGKSGQEERELRLERDEQAVRIVTMHSAKGLQYPVVFCPLLWYRADRDQKSEVVSCHENGQQVVDLGSAKMAARRQLAAKESLAEDLRLAYVALTRAELCCYTVWADVKQRSGWLASSQDSALGWLLFAGEAGDFARQSAELRRRGQEAGCAYRLVPATAPPAARYLPELPRIPSLVPRPPGSRSLTTDYQLSSYSAMASLSEQEDHGAEPPEETDEDPGPEILHPNMPMGADFGNLIHGVLEGVPFSSLARGAGNEEVIAGLCRRYGLELDPIAVQALLATIVTSPLGAGTNGFCLAELDERRRVCEMPFYFKISRLDTRRINEVLAAEPSVVPLSAKAMRGYLTGFIDLFCEYGGKYYLLDYKTNFLGNHLADYQPERTVTVMASHNYGLQYWIYTLVVHRYLQNTLPGYRYDQHFGGVFYLFVRGMSPQIAGGGVFHTLPPAATLARLAAAVEELA